MKDTDRFSAGGDHSPETFISHYPEREGWREGEGETAEDSEKEKRKGEDQKDTGEQG